MKLYTDYGPINLQWSVHLKENLYITGTRILNVTLGIIDLLNYHVLNKNQHHVLNKNQNQHHVLNKNQHHILNKNQHHLLNKNQHHV